MKKTERTIKQIVAAVKGAVAGRDAREVTCASSFEPAAIRVSPHRFVLVRDILDVNGVAPGDTNVFFSAAMAAAEKFGIVTEEESDRFFEWQNAEEKANNAKRAIADLEHKAQTMGFQLVKRRAPPRAKAPKRRR